MPSFFYLIIEKDVKKDNKDNVVHFTLTFFFSFLFCRKIIMGTWVMKKIKAVRKHVSVYFRFLMAERLWPSINQ